MKIDDETLKKIHQCGLYQFDQAFIADLLGMDKEKLANEMRDEDSDVRKYYVKGRKEARLVMRQLLYTAATKDGNLAAIKQINDLIDVADATFPI